MWHIGLNGQAKGPFTDEQVKGMCEAGLVNAATLVWRAGMSEWKPLGQSDFPFKDTAGAPPLSAPQSFVGQQAPGTLAPNQQPLAPVEDLSVWGYYARCMSSRYAGFEGRARRKEYWSNFLFWVIFLVVAIGIGIGIDAALGNLGTADGGDAKPTATVIIGLLYYLATLIPGLAVLIRRMHDLGLSGWIVLISLIPYIGGLALFVMTLLPSQEKTNDHGPKPRWT